MIDEIRAAYVAKLDQHAAARVDVFMEHTDELADMLRASHTLLAAFEERGMCEHEAIGALIEVWMVLVHHVNPDKLGE